MKQITFKKEKDFNKINHLPFNREYSVRNDLIKSMNKSGFIVPIILMKTDIIDGQDKLWVLDGQNRLITARFLQLEATGVIIEPSNINTLEDMVKLVSSLNSNSKRWNLLDYVEAYNFLNYKHYRDLLRITHNSPYTVNTISSLLMNVPSRVGCSKIVQEGRFKAHDKEGTLEVINYAAYLSRHERVTARMLTALKRVMSLKKFDKDKFSRKYENNINIIRELKLDDYTDIFSEWIN
tara:strand:+ start:15430 stop:16140 length:711 start_codon:yes stop_codon:yes gene_type:complete